MNTLLLLIHLAEPTPVTSAATTPLFDTKFVNETIEPVVPYPKIPLSPP
jgi:hypothetical protein